jgi:hypothetical protein
MDRGWSKGSVPAPVGGYGGIALGSGLCFSVYRTVPSLNLYFSGFLSPFLLNIKDTQLPCVFEEKNTSCVGTSLAQSQTFFMQTFRI